MTQSLDPVSFSSPMVRELLDQWWQNKSPITRQRYGQALADFARWRGREPMDAVRELLALGHGPANFAALEYCSELQRRGLRASTIAQRLSALRAALAAFRRAGLIPWALEVDPPRRAKSRIVGPSIEALREAWAATDELREPRRSRVRLQFRLFFDLAFRVFEVGSLDWPGNFEFERSAVPLAIWVRRKKEPEPSRWGLAPATLVALEEHLRRRGGAPGPLFVARGTRRQTDRSIRDSIMDLGRRAGIALSPNRIRHTANTSAVVLQAGERQDLTLDELRQFSGHADLRTLMLYRDKVRDVQTSLSESVSRLLDAAT